MPEPSSLDVRGPFEVLLLADQSGAVIGDIHYVCRSGSALILTPIGHFAATPRPGLPEEAAHWKVDLYFRLDIRHNAGTGTLTVDPKATSKDSAALLDPLPDALADALLASTACSSPLLLNVYRGHNMSFVQRGTICDE